MKTKKDKITFILCVFYDFVMIMSSSAVCAHRVGVARSNTVELGYCDYYYYV